MSSFSFKITRSGKVVFEDGTTWDDVPEVTGDDIKAFRKAMNMSQAELAPYLNLATKAAISQLEGAGPNLIPSKAARVRFLLLREKNTAEPVGFWEPEQITVQIADVAGYFNRHVCGVGPIEMLGKVEQRPDGCGTGYWSTNKQRVYCMKCRPYEGTVKVMSNGSHS